MQRIVKKIISLICCLSIMAVQFSFVSYAVTYPVMGVINSTAQIYSKAGTTGHEIKEEKNQSKWITELAKNTKIKVLGTAVDGDEDTWYKIGYGENYANTGYAFNTKVTLTGEYIEDPEFEKWLTEQGFPESYKEPLRNLHALYPNWVFYADHITDSWSTVLSKYTGIDKKVVNGTSDISWKSYEKGAYDWDTGKWYSFDSGEWYAPDDRVVAYHMDPRNFLNTTHIFMFFSQSYNAELDTEDNLVNFLKGTFMEGSLPDLSSKTYAQVLMEAAQSSKVSPYVLASIIRQEQGTNGAGASISGTVSGYKGYYNYFNIGAYAEGSMTAVQRGLWWAKGAGKNDTSYSRPWNTHEKAIKGGAVWYGEGYISVGQDTLFYKNFNIYKNTKHKLYTHQYATNIADTKSSATTLGAAYLELYEEKLSFHIPVYEDMPEKTSLPKTGTNNDRFLKGIKVGDTAIANFDRYTYEYEMIVPFATSSVKITGTKSNSASTVTGEGTYDLTIGDNDFEIKVTSSSGLKTTYKLTIHREADSGTTEVLPEITTTYKVEEYITGVEPATTIADFKTKLGVKNGVVKIIGANDSEKTSGNIATGDKVYIYKMDNTLHATHIVVIYGDTNGDGKITSVDLLTGQRHILGIAKLTAANLQAADINRDGKVTSVDLLTGQRHILDIKKIEQ